VPRLLSSKASPHMELPNTELTPLTLAQVAAGGRAAGQEAGEKQQGHILQLRWGSGVPRRATRETSGHSSPVNACRLMNPFYVCNGSALRAVCQVQLLGPADSSDRVRGPGCCEHHGTSLLLQNGAVQHTCGLTNGQSQQQCCHHRLHSDCAVNLKKVEAGDLAQYSSSISSTTHVRASDTLIPLMHTCCGKHNGC
jgi:hypothetical protein